MASDPPTATDGALAASKRGGLNAEHGAVETIGPLTPVSDSVAEHYDAVTEAALCPSDVPMVGVCRIPAGTNVEIKSVMAVYGEAQRRGRYKLRQTQHEALVADDGVYLFAVCEPRPTRPIIKMKIVPAWLVDSLVETHASWRDEKDDRGPKAQFAWTRIFTPAEIEA